MNTQRIEIVRANAANAEEIRNIADTSWEDTYANDVLGITREKIRARYVGKEEERSKKLAEAIKNLNWKTNGCWVAKVDGKVVGFVRPNILDGKARVGALYILPSYTGMGIGKQLTDKVIELYKGKDIYLQCATYNEKAMRFYESFGFEAMGGEDVVNTGGMEIPVIWMVKKGT